VKVLILSVTAGQGHNTTAKAIAEAFKKRGHEIEIIDAFAATNKLLYKIIDKGYLLAAYRLGYFYGKSYYSLEHRKANSYKSSPERRLYRFIAKKINRLIREKKPDVVIGVHVFTVFVLDLIKERYGLDAKTVGVVTDFVMHPYWEETLRVDRVVLANELMIPCALEKGLKEEQLLTTGIPVHPKFADQTDANTAKMQLGLRDDMPMLLMALGTVGHNRSIRLLKAIDRLSAKFQIVTICGNNKKIYRAIQKRKWQRPLFNVGFSEKVDLFMDAADCIISKPGGLTASEALAKRLPMIMINPIHGQEVRNSEFFTKHGIALSAKDPAAVCAHLAAFFEDEKIRVALKEKIDGIRKPNAAKDLCTHVENMLKNS